MNKITTSLNRFFSNEELAAKFYLWWLIFVIVIVGFYGIYPASRSIYKKIGLSKKMSQLNKDLGKKQSEIEESLNDMALVINELSYLEEYLPEDFETQNYMIEFVFSTTRAGFDLQKFLPQTSSDSRKVNMSVSLTGSGNATDLIKTIEGMNRITEVNRMTFSPSKDMNIVNLNLSTYILR